MDKTIYVVYVRQSVKDFARLLPGQPKYIARAEPPIPGFEGFQGTGNYQLRAVDVLIEKLAKIGVKNNLTCNGAVTIIPE